MGLPIDKLVVCTNQNDVLHRFLQTGTYCKSPAVLTIAPSMDISVSSNFERYLYYLAGESSDLLSSWMNTFESTGQITVPTEALHAAQQDFCSFTADKLTILRTMKGLHDKEGYLVCPHTATAVAAVQSLLAAAAPASATTTSAVGTAAGNDAGASSDHSSAYVCLATAHAAKFEEAVQLALALDNDTASLLTTSHALCVGACVTPPACPAELQALYDLPTRKVKLPNSLEQVESFIRGKLST